MTERDRFWTEQEIRDRISISTYVFSGFQPICERTLSELTSGGIRKIELSQSPQRYDVSNKESMRFMRELFSSCGIELVAFHCNHVSFDRIRTEQERVETVDVCKKQLDTLMELGGTVWGSHAGTADIIVTKSYEELARYVEGTDVAVTVENFPYVGREVEDRVAFLDSLNHPNAGMILDIGHVIDGSNGNPMAVPGGPTRVIDVCAKHLRHLHMHGFKDGRDHHPPLTDGDTIQWVELFRMLKEVDYPGAFNFEPAGKPLHTDSVERTARFPQEIVALEASQN